MLYYTYKRALNIIQMWCIGTELILNPSKVVLVVVGFRSNSPFNIRLYTVVIKPLLLYASLVWLQQVQRILCIDTTTLLNQP